MHYIIYNNWYPYTTILYIYIYIRILSPSRKEIIQLNIKKIKLTQYIRAHITNVIILIQPVRVHSVPSRNTHVFVVRKPKLNTRWIWLRLF